MAQGYTRPQTQTGQPAQLRQALGYIPARAQADGSDGGITVEGGPSGQTFTLTPIGAGAVLGNLGPGDDTPHALDFTFVKLTDTFGDLLPAAGMGIRVNVLGTALEPYTLPATTFAAGAPASPGVSEGDLYFDTTLAVYVGYVWHSAAWNQF